MNMLYLNLLFLAFFAAYVVHILDEALLNHGFVQWIVNNFWPTYNIRMFFGSTPGQSELSRSATFSLTALEAIGSSCRLSGWRFATHALTVHLYWTVRCNTYSPGLLSSTLYLFIFYLAVRYGLWGHLITINDFITGTVVGVATVGAFLTVGPTWLFPRIMRTRG